MKGQKETQVVIFLIYLLLTLSILAIWNDSLAGDTQVLPVLPHVK